MSERHFVIREGHNVPDHWYVNSWEEKARENPLYAVMTTPDLLGADAGSFTAAQLAPFFAKGRRVYERHVKPCVARARFPPAETFLVEYGCGVGRVLSAVVEAGHACAGIDISSTMLRHCARLVPGEKSLHAFDAAGRTDLQGSCATTVFSFAVLKHIPRLSEYERTVEEICRLLRPGGTLALNVNTQDFIGGDLTRPERTKNFETRSLHYSGWGIRPYRKRVYSTWSGVYIGIGKLRSLLAAGGVEAQNLRQSPPRRVRHH